MRNPHKKLPHFVYLSVENFKKQLDFFEKHFGFVRFEDFCALGESTLHFQTLQHKILLTFDDGFIDHYKYVLPELKRRGLFGLFFVPTGIYERQKALDVHRIHFLLGYIGGGDLMKFARSLIKDFMLEKISEFKTITYTKQNNEIATKEFKKLFNYYIKYAFREQVLDEIVKEFSSDDEIFMELYMSESNLAEMHKENMIIGSHSKSHFVFSKLDKDAQNSEIKDSFCFLENLLGGFKVKTFCYPYGGFHTFTNLTEDILRKESVKFAFNVESRDIDLNDLQSRPLALPRYDCNEFAFGKASLGY